MARNFDTLLQANKSKEETSISFLESVTDNILHHVQDHFMGHGQELRKTLTEGKEEPDGMDYEKNAPIHSLVKRKAVNKKQKQEKMHLLVTLLTFGDVDIDQCNGEGHTALHIAVMMGDIQVIKILIAFGANINAVGYANQTPINLLKGPLRVCSRLKSPLGFMACELPGIKHQAGVLLSTDRKVYTVTSFSCDLERGSSLSTQSIDELISLLESAGGKPQSELKERQIEKHPRYSISLPAAKSVAKRSITPENRFQYNLLLDEMIKKCLGSIGVESQSTEDKTDLMRYMRESRALQMAGSRILFLDGGGMRGLIQVGLLSQLEKRTGKRVTELFDWIVGTSTGAILALGLVYGKRSLAEMRQFYCKAREDVFKDPHGGITFDSDAFEHMIVDAFGEMKMNDVQHPKVLVTATYKKTSNLKLHLFSNVFEDSLSNELVWKVARYTSAAPIYFTEVDNYVDGGILANNPSSVGLAAIQSYYRAKKQKLPISLVVSIGTGIFDDVDIGNIDATEYLYFGKHWFHALSGLTERIKSLSTRKEVLKHITEKIVDRFISFQFHTDVHKSTDHVQEYGMQFLSLGCFYLEYSDAIREGDGGRVLQCWKYLLAIFKSSGRKNYSIEALNMLYQYEYELTPRQSAELLWNRFINIQGIQGRNIPCDLHPEHLNRICKNAISDLGVNKTEKAIIRVGNVLGTLSPVLQQYDLENHVRDTCGTHRAPKSDKDRDQIILQLQQLDIFSSPESRTHQTFPKPRDVLHDFNHDKLF